MKILKHFEEGKRYAFSAHRFIATTEGWRSSRDWIEEADGQPVRVYGKRDGKTTIHNYLVSPKWCVEVK